MSNAALPLAGVRVLELCPITAGPLCCRYLAGLGATVVKVEPPGGDPTRSLSPKGPDGTGYLFSNNNAGKQSVRLDLKRQEALVVLHRLIERVDVLVESYGPGVAERLGFDVAAATARNSRLVYASISGYGRSGPSRHLKALDMTVQARTGIMGLTGHPDAPPVKVGISLCDDLAATAGAGAIATALLARAATGRAQRVDAGMFDAAAWTTQFLWPLVAAGQTAERRGNRHPYTCPHDVYEAADGLVAVAAETDLERQRLREVIAFVDDALEWSEQAEAALAVWLAARTASEASQLLQSAGVPAWPVDDVREVLDRLRDSAPDLLQTWDVGSGHVTVVGVPFRFAAAGRPSLGRPPRLGEHTLEVLRDLGGFGEAEIRGLLDAGVI